MVSKRIKDLPRVVRPREKLKLYGPEKLTSSELLALILGSGSKGENVIEFSKKILRKFSGEGLSETTLKELTTFPGLGPARGARIIACFELGKRYLQEKRTRIYLSSKEIYNELKDTKNLKKEHFFVFYLDTRKKEIKRELISIGSLNQGLVHPREVFEPAVKHLAASIILAHNHPSGDPNPSEEDILITKRLKKAGDLLDIKVKDHIIIGSEGYFSFKEKKLIL